jgi:hypothetical protein
VLSHLRQKPVSPGGLEKVLAWLITTSQQATVTVTEATDASKRWHSSAWDKIKAEIEKVLDRLWSMISKLVTVKEWTLTGKVGTGVLGLAEASVSVTSSR